MGRNYGKYGKYVLGDFDGTYFWEISEKLTYPFSRDVVIGRIFQMDSFLRSLILIWIISKGNFV